MVPNQGNKQEKDSWLSYITSATLGHSKDMVVPLDSSDQDLTEPLSVPIISHHLIKRYSLISLAATAAVLLITVLGATFFAKLAIGSGQVSSNISDAQLAADIKQQASDYRLAVAYPNGSTKTYTLASAGLNLDAQATVTNTRKSDTFLRRLQWWKPLGVQLDYNVKVISLNNFISDNINVTVQPSIDATLTISGSDIKVSNASQGLRYGLTNPGGLIMSSAGSLNSIPLKLQTLAVNPALTATALMPYKAQLQKILAQPASFEIAGQTVKPSSQDIASWLDITPNDKDKSLSITVNSGKVQSYIDAVAGNYIRPAKAEIDVQQSDGSTQVLVPGENGVTISNESSIASEVASSLMSAKGFRYALPVSYAPYTTITAGDWPQWIEVDLTHYRLYAYDNATLVNTFLISAGRPSTPTPTGQFAIQRKFVQQDMYGENVDGSSYYQPNVPWINYFSGGFAIHGNYWRPTSYFGSVNSSHGCVGLMVNDAEWVYNWAPIGTPIIIHN